MLRSSSSCFWRRIIARCVCVCIHVCVTAHCVCVCVCVRERERERERAVYGVCVREMFMVCV